MKRPRNVIIADMRKRKRENVTKAIAFLERNVAVSHEVMHVDSGYRMRVKVALRKVGVAAGPIATSSHTFIASDRPDPQRYARELIPGLVRSAIRSIVSRSALAGVSGRVAL